MKRIVLALALILGIGNLSAVTYYIDYSGGSDSNNGTAKATPWKHHPYMYGWSGGAYTHVKGNDFIFKGGVTWPRAAMPMRIVDGGTSSNISEYKTDLTWYNGGSFTRPQFTCGGLTMLSNSTLSCMIQQVGTAGQYIELNNLYIHGWTQTYRAGNDTDGWGVGIYASGNIRVINCWIKNMIPALFPVGTQGLLKGLEGGGMGGDYNIGLVGYREMIDCEVEGPLTIPSGINNDATHPQGQGAELAGGRWSSGTGAKNLTLVSNCDFQYLTQGVWACGILEDSEIWNCGDDWDYDTHENAIHNRGHGSMIIRRNWVHDIGNDGTSLQDMIAWGGGSDHHAHIYNNVFGPNIPQNNVNIEQSTVTNNHEAWIVNNVYINQYPGVYATGAPVWGGPVVRANNVVISDTLTTGSAFAALNPTTNAPAIYDINMNNSVITHAQASDAGMIFERLYKPNKSVSGVTGAGLNFASGNPTGAPSVNHGLNFSTDFEEATRSAPWDRGAYEFGGTIVAIPGNIQLSSSTYSTPEGTNITFTATRGGGDDGAVSAGWTASNAYPVSAASGTDYTAASGTFSWANGDSANKTATITVAQDATIEGDEAFLFTISSPTGGAIIGSPAQAIATIIDDESAATLVPLLGLSFQAEDMLVETPFAETATYISQPVTTTTPSAGGRARADVTIPSTGNYRVAMSVAATTSANDSIFVDFDAEPTTPTAIWDVIPLTVGTQQRNVSWRGTGAFDAPQFVDKEWALTSGVHRLYIRGREPGMQIDSVTIFSASVADTSPPTPDPAVIDDMNASSVSVSIAAQPAADITGPVEYQFEITGGPGALTSAFQADPLFEARLYPGKSYSVRVRSRDGASTPNVGEWSEPGPLLIPTIQGTGTRRPRSPR